MKLEKSNRLLSGSKRIIPGGSTFNKTNFFDQGYTPFSIARGQGVTVWDVDGNRYTDFILGLGCVLLGYRTPEIDKAVTAQLENGISFSLMHPLELEVAEKLTEAVPCAEMVRFGKNGSDVLSAAVRLSRYITGRRGVAFCGYHGWHDWCIAKTSRPGGIPEVVRDLSHRFVYNDIDSLDRLVSESGEEIACVVMDAVARYYPETGFLEDVRELTQKHGILLVFDEIVTGFRMPGGSAQAFFNIVPDLACFGKAMGNGMPIAALVGREEFMRRFDEIFFSLTYAGETLSLAAASTVLELCKESRVPEQLYSKGEPFRTEIQKLIDAHHLGQFFELQGMPSRIIIGFRDRKESDSFLNKGSSVNDILTMMIRAFAERGILYNSSLFVSQSLTQGDINHFLESLDAVLTAVGTEVRQV